MVVILGIHLNLLTPNYNNRLTVNCDYSANNSLSEQLLLYEMKGLLNLYRVTQ